MTEYLSEHWILSIVVTIFLGAIGSGLWDALLKPIGNKTAKIVFGLLTFGTKRASNRIFKEAAKGHHDGLSLEILTIVMCAFIAILIATQALLYVKSYSPNLIYASLEECLKVEKDLQKDCITKEIKPTIHKSTLLFVFIVVVIFYQLISLTLINTVITRYEQSLKSIRPFLEDNEFFLIEQKFSTMSTKEDFEKIITQMKTIAKKNDFSLP